MKRLYSVLLLFLLAVVMAGCAVQESGETVSVSDINGLLENLVPGATIELEAGTYILSEAPNYGDTVENGCYTWEPVWDGYQLVIHDVEDLTLRARGSSVLKTENPYGNVLVLENCANVVLEGFSVERTGSMEGASGVELHGCTNVMVQDLQISGCGMMGIQVDNCQNVTLSGSEIRRCAFAGIHASQSDGLIVEKCTFRELGGEAYNCTVFLLQQTGNVQVSGCEVSDNKVQSLIDCYPCNNVVFEKNVFLKNRIRTAVFDVDGGLVFDSNVVENNVIPAWFSTERATVLDGIGKSWNEEMLKWYYHPPVESLPDGEQEEIHVTSVEDLLKAIGPNRRIVLEEEFYDLSTAPDYGTGYHDYYYWSEEFDGPGLVITDVENMTICSADGDAANCTLSAVPRYANVLSFRRCSGITLSGFTAGHTAEPGYCMGGVLYFRDCDRVRVEACGLYGCGILGVQAELSGNITVKDCEIYECSYGGIQMSEVYGVSIENCTFRDLGGESMAFFDCKDVAVNGEAVSGNMRID